MRDLTTMGRIECDEIWGYIHCKQKQKHAKQNAPEAWGDSWTWVAMDAQTKLIPSYWVGKREGADAIVFMADLASRLACKV